MSGIVVRPRRESEACAIRCRGREARRPWGPDRRRAANGPAQPSAGPGHGRRSLPDRPGEQLGNELLPAEARELLDDRGHLALDEVDAAVDVGIVVATLALERARKPARPVGVGFSRPLGPGRSSGGRSSERVRTLGADRLHQLLGPARAHQIDRPAVAEARIQTEQPGTRRVRLVNAKQVRPDELEQVDPLGVERIDARTLQPASDARAADAEQVGDGGKSRLSASIFAFGRPAAS
jgi:hypothetical protein